MGTSNGQPERSGWWSRWVGLFPVGVALGVGGLAFLIAYLLYTRPDAHQQMRAFRDVCGSAPAPEVVAPRCPDDETCCDFCDQVRAADSGRELPSCACLVPAGVGSGGGMAGYGARVRALSVWAASVFGLVVAALFAFTVCVIAAGRRIHSRRRRAIWGSLYGLGFAIVLGGRLATTTTGKNLAPDCYAEFRDRLLVDIEPWIPGFTGHLNFAAFVLAVAIVSAVALIVQPPPAGGDDDATHLAKTAWWLRTLLFSAAAFLVAGMFEITSLFSLVSLQGGRVPWIEELGASLASVTGGVATVFLAGLYVPAAMIIERRVANLELDVDNEADRLDWLDRNGLRLSWQKQLVRVLVVLSPALIGNVGADLLALLG